MKCGYYERKYSGQWFSILCGLNPVGHIFSDGKRAIYEVDPAHEYYQYDKSLRDKFVDEVCKIDCSKCNLIKVKSE